MQTNVSLTFCYVLPHIHHNCSIVSTHRYLDPCLYTNLEQPEAVVVSSGCAVVTSGAAVVASGGAVVTSGALVVDGAWVVGGGAVVGAAVVVGSLHLTVAPESST